MFIIWNIPSDNPVSKRDVVVSITRRPTDSFDGQMEFVNSRCSTPKPAFCPPSIVMRSREPGRWGHGAAHQTGWHGRAGGADFQGPGSAAEKVAETKNLCSTGISLSATGVRRILGETPGSQPEHMPDFLKHNRCLRRNPARHPIQRTDRYHLRIHF